MTKYLVWNVDTEHGLFSEQIFEIFRMSEVTPTRFEADPNGELEGILHPLTGELVQLKGPFEDYGTVYDEGELSFEETSADDLNVDIPAVVTGTPTLEVVEEDDWNWDEEE